MSKVLIFLSGAVTGAALSFLYLRNKYSKKYDEAINYYYSNAPKTGVETTTYGTVNAQKDISVDTSQETNELSRTAEIVRHNYSDMQTIIHDNNYAGKEEGSKDCMSDYYAKEVREAAKDAGLSIGRDLSRPYKIEEEEVEEYISNGYETLDLTFYEDMVLAETRSHEAIEEPSTMIGPDNYRHLMDLDGDLYVADDTKKMLYFIDHSRDRFDDIY